MKRESKTPREQHCKDMAVGSISGEEEARWKRELPREAWSSLWSSPEQRPTHTAVLRNGLEQIISSRESVLLFSLLIPMLISVVPLP